MRPLCANVRAQFSQTGPLTKGMALIEALMATAVLGAGLAAATRLTLHTLQTAHDTRQHTIALALALDAMECHQSGRSACTVQTSIVVLGTTYSLYSQLQARPGLALVDLQVRVQWPAMGLRAGAVPDGSAGHGPLGTRELMIYSSRDAVPSWVGVSSP